VAEAAGAAAVRLVAFACALNEELLDRSAAVKGMAVGTGLMAWLSGLAAHAWHSSLSAGSVEAVFVAGSGSERTV